MNILKLFDYNQKKKISVLIFLSFIASCAEILNLAIILPIINTFLGTNDSFFNGILLNLFNAFNFQVKNTLLVLIVIFVFFFNY